MPKTASTTNRNHLDSAAALESCKRNDVQVAIAAGDKLARLHLFQMIDLVTILSRLFIMLRTGSGLHAAYQAGNHLLALATQKQQGILYLPRVISSIDFIHTRCGTTLDLVLQARPGAMAEIAVFTVT